MYYEIFKSKSPQYLFKLILEKKKTSSYVTRHADNFPRLNTKHNFYKNSLILFFRWRSLSEATQILTFGKQKVVVLSKIIFLNLLDPNQTVFFNCFNLKGIRVITRLRLELSHVHEHEFVYNFQSCLNPLCDRDFLVYCVTLYIKIQIYININIFPVLHF